MCEKCGHLPISGYIGVGPCCVPLEQQINYKPPVDPLTGELTDEAVYEIHCRIASNPLRVTADQHEKIERTIAHAAAAAKVKWCKAELIKKVEQLSPDKDDELSFSPIWGQGWATAIMAVRELLEGTEKHGKV